MLVGKRISDDKPTQIVELGNFDNETYSIYRPALSLNGETILASHSAAIFTVDILKSCNRKCAIEHASKMYLKMCVDCNIYNVARCQPVNWRSVALTLGIAGVFTGVMLYVKREKELSECSLY